MREVEIGRTVLGRPMVALFFAPPSYARVRPPAVLVGALHGDEPVAPPCLLALAQELIERPPGRATWIVPALNLDGLAAGTKNNARDVDLDRNFAASNWSREHAPGHAPGPEPESEPETRALVELIERAGATRLLCLRTTYRLVDWQGRGEALARDMAGLNGYPVTHDTRALAPGSFAMKYGADLDREVVTLEMPFLGIDPDAEAERAFAEHRAALRHALDLPTG